MRWKIDDLPVFVAIAETGGITAAATRLNMPKSSVSTALARLEEALGLRLVERSTRSLRLTGEGETFVQLAQAISEQAREADALMMGLTQTPRGRLTVSLPPAFAQEVLAPRLPAFHARYPEVALDLGTSPGKEVLPEGCDIAVVVGALEDSDLVARKLIAGPLVWVASPKVAAALPAAPDPAEVPAYVAICERRYALPRLPVHVLGRAAQIDMQTGISRTDDPLIVRQAVMSGGGAALLPRRYCRDQLAAGTLKEVFANISLDLAASQLSAVYSSRRLMSPRLRVFLDFLTEVCSGV
ncbi:LysR family transcriptional regulator [Pseudoprimorskyibacter insulae]|uniref:HTH-type transcriptional regulator PgrR n=1 Tax=Pseudoprimorskyibacter insulae TaxID=1695997 RepID=A0A2R8B020_9RHOB|nr:LysR family transcriptional regulator [Pseudoprimorskyibacter insulae]SPF81474.1 HTH-type transcriptional regulator PgrR [Pseudoprimorskyibacter insulae]